MLLFFLMNNLLTSVIYCYILNITVGGDLLKILISNSSSVPIYEQIKNSIIEQIMNNELKEEEPLPSIRSLAFDIHISVMTVKKAYDELEKEGYIVTRQGKGSFVAPKNMELLRETKLQEMENYLSKALDIANFLHLSITDVQELLKYLDRREKE